ncbi:hypothetical protein FACS1894185_0120 [Betaproteobacteria bacterium]|nr:hypothetical protein FACS1894185_0120 [Betaproteobacteria bacterium]GHU15750.1 hypothetical protein FACS189441_7820 [Betaproteobacteria bacterium]
MNAKFIAIVAVLLIASNATTYGIASSSTTVNSENVAAFHDQSVLCPKSQYDKDMEEAKANSHAAYEAELKRLGMFEEYQKEQGK